MLLILMAQHASHWKVSHHCGWLTVAIWFQHQIQTQHPHIGNFLHTEAWNGGLGYPIPDQHLSTSSAPTRMCGCHHYAAETRPTSDLSFGFRQDAKSFLRILTLDTVCVPFNNMYCTVVLFWHYCCCICVIRVRTDITSLQMSLWMSISQTFTFLFQ